jgi:hypothetical protein
MVINKVGAIQLSVTRVEAGSNTSTVTLRVVGGDEKRSQLSDSNIWSWVPRDSDPTKNALAGARSKYKRQTRPLVREGAPQKQDRICQKIINIWSRARDGARYQDLLTDRQSQCDFDFDLTPLGLNKLRHRLLHYPALTDVPVYSRTYIRVSLCFVKMYNMYISPTLMWPLVE